MKHLSAAQDRVVRMMMEGSGGCIVRYYGWFSGCFWGMKRINQGTVCALARIGILDAPAAKQCATLEAATYYTINREKAKEYGYDV